MQITVKYMAQLRQTAGVGEETLDVQPDTSLSSLIRHLADLHADSFRRILLDENGDIRASVLYFAGEEQLSGDSQTPLTDSATITVLAPMAGGALY